MNNLIKSYSLFYNANTNKQINIDITINIKPTIIILILSPLFI